MTTQAQKNEALVSKGFARTEKAKYYFVKISLLKQRLPKPLAPWWQEKRVPHDFPEAKLQDRINRVLYKYAQDAPLVEYLYRIAEAYEAQLKQQAI